MLLTAWSRNSINNRWTWRGPEWARIFRILHRNHWGRPLDEFPRNAGTLVKMYREVVLRGSPFNQVFDLLQMIMRHSECPRQFTLGVARVFQECRLAYVVDTRKPPTILPAATAEEGEAIVGAIGELRKAGLRGAEAHLKRAGELIDGGDWSGSVRESVHAVESVARSLDSDSSKTLGPALDSLEKSGRLHPALREAFNRLYGYTSDEQGIRHALLDSSTSAVGRDEAVFMLGACASFSSYLWRRSRKDG